MYMGFRPHRPLSYFFRLEGPSKDDRSWMWYETSSRLNDWGPVARTHLMHGRIVTKEVIPIKAGGGARPCDVYSTDSQMFICSRTILDILQAHSDRPLIAQSVALYDKADKKVIHEDLVWLQMPLIIGAGPVDLNRGAPLLASSEWRKDPENAFGLYFDTVSWNGGAVFCFPNYHGVYITEPVMEAIKATNPSGVVMTALPELRRGLCDSMLRGFQERAPHMLPPQFRDPPENETGARP